MGKNDLINFACNKDAYIVFRLKTHAINVTIPLIMPIISNRIVKALEVTVNPRDIWENSEHNGRHSDPQKTSNWSEQLSGGASEKVKVPFSEKLSQDGIGTL